jgi:DNA-binding HxlR family transcriptional regulator
MPENRKTSPSRPGGRTTRTSVRGKAVRNRDGTAGGRKGGRRDAVRALSRLKAARGQPPETGRAEGARRRGTKGKLGMQVLCKVTIRDESGSKVSRLQTAVGEGRVPASWSLERRREVLGARLRRSVRVGRTARILGVLGSRHRLRILGALAGGGATYRGLVKTTGLAAGPLYHHVNQLRLAGLVRPKERDLYEITPKGTRCLLMAVAMGRMR